MKRILNYLLVRVITIYNSTNIKTKHMKSLKIKMLYGAVCFLTSLPIKAQNIPVCSGVFEDTTQAQNLLGPTCTNNSAAYNTYYSKQSFWVPGSLDPVITVKLTVHVFEPNWPLVGQWVNSNDPNLPNGTPELMNFFYDSHNGQADQYSAQRSPLNPAYYFIPGFVSPHILDSRLKYEITNVYYYQNDFLYGYNALINGGGYHGPFFNYIDSVDSNRLDEGLPIIINGNGGGYQGYWNGAPCVVTSAGPGDINFFREHMRHELAHCFTLKHTYNWNYKESIDCNLSNNPDFLSDVFPQNNTVCNPYPTGNACNTCYEDNATLYTNNVMSAGFGPMNKWMSPLQQGRRIRCMHLPANGVRRFAKEVVSQHFAPLQITSNQTWDFDIQMYKDILVKAGYTLTIKCKVAMAIDGIIRVEKGARLIIDGGHVTGWCKSGQWEGIEVEGTSNQNQSISGGYGLYQGYVSVINGGKLSHADNAIKTAITDINGNIMWNTTGGIVVCNNAYFIDNRRDVEFEYYNGFNNISSFTRCTFQTNGLLRGNTVPGARVTLYEVKGVVFRGCTFEYNAGSTYNIGSRGDGIYSYDASYIIDQVCNSPFSPCGSFIRTKFARFENGVKADCSNPLRVVSICNTDFLDNLTFSAFFNNIHAPIFNDNYVRTAGLGSGTGLYLYKSKYYSIKNNTFLNSSTTSNKVDVGIHAVDCRDGAHLIYRNNFANFNVGINCIGNNSGITNNTDGLKMNCNDFTPGALNKYDIAMHDNAVVDILPRATVKTNQGATLQPWQTPTAMDLVRNIYGAPAQCTTCENRWYMGPNTMATPSGIKITAHPANQDLSTRPMPQRNYSDYAVSISNSGIQLNYAQHCPTTIASGGGGGWTGQVQQMANINNHIHELLNEAEVDEYELQATVATKMGLFLIDTILQDEDSVISLLASNVGSMEDADIQLIYAYMNKGDYATAEDLVNSLGTERADWAALLEKLIEIHESSDKALSIASSTSDIAFFTTYANTEGMDGQGAAQALLRYATATDYEVPYVLPEPGSEKADPMENIMVDNGLVSVFPNPFQAGVTIQYTGKESIPVTIEVKDLQGKVVYTNFVNSLNKEEIPLDGLSNGVYLLSVTQQNETIYRDKLIKQE